VTDPILETRGLSRTFGAVVAVDDVDLSVTAGRVHAVIGPNGAGKTTLLNLLSGELRPSAGRVRFAGRDITGLPSQRIARAGIGRSFQRTNVFPDFTCLDTCRLGAQGGLGTSMRFFRAADRDPDVAEAAARALEQTGLAARAATPAGVLSHGEQRQLEIAMVLAGRPRLLLLDEPLAGMGAGEAERMLALLKSLARDHTIVLVEHDMDAVFAVADELTVMVGGCILESGPPERIRASASVQDAYLGEP
jgi:branched-chain amino acid transport system ATP-binding protein